VLYGIWVVDYSRGNAGRALEYAQQFLSLAEMQPASAPRVIGHRLLGAVQLMSGDFRQARPHLELAASLYRAEEHREFAFRYGQDIGASALCCLSWALWHTGHPDQAARTADRALLHAREFGHAYTLAYTLWHVAMPALLSRDVPRVEWLANENATISGERGFPQFLAHCDVLLGWVAAHRGQGADCIDRMRRGIAAKRRQQGPIFVSEPFPGAAAPLDAAVRPDCSSMGGLVCRSSRPDLDKAERSLRAALSIAREQGTKGFELCSTWRSTANSGAATSCG
jgi:predicted ATPase